MAAADPRQMIVEMLRPWELAVEDPKGTQRSVLEDLLAGYRQTQYGADHNAAEVNDIRSFREHFPARTYDGFSPWIQRVMKGETSALLYEGPLGWAITRGTTKGESKFIPMTPTDIKIRVSAGRAVMNYALSSGQFDLFGGVNLNLNFPSRVGTIQVGDREVEYGYSSGIYTRFVSERTPIRSVPAQEEIDALGGGKTKADWEARFELAYRLCRDENVTLVGGVAPTAMKFGGYLRREHGCYPKDLWDPKIMTLGSMPGINTRLAPALTAMYGTAAIREIYGATEGMFGQQRDEQRAWVPNYDLFFLEAETRSGVKMLYEMRPGETGNLIVSTPVFPRYRINDRILALRSPYYRCIGRDDWWTNLAYFWGELSSFNLGRL